MSPFSKGIEALRKLRRVFCGRGSSLVRCTPPIVPLAKGDKPLAFGTVMHDVTARASIYLINKYKIAF